ncbi:hypothetical protein B0H13DRAFT_2045125 [Mycena leptocephala]|nr:hypothetical protein B0H13DRAFT_2045125 [Mycena leptocephala]
MRAVTGYRYVLAHFCWSIPVLPTTLVLWYHDIATALLPFLDNCGKCSPLGPVTDLQACGSAFSHLILRDRSLVFLFLAFFSASVSLVRHAGFR